MEIPVKTVNHGFVTAPLEASLVDQLPPGVRAELSPELLKGIAEERRTLRVTLTKAGPTDIAVSFRARNDIPNLGGRDRVSFLGEEARRAGRSN
jgi:hypothetical protein